MDSVEDGNGSLAGSNTPERFRVFLASPGDVPLERKLAREAITHIRSEQSVEQALDELLLPPQLVVLRGNREALEVWQAVAAGLYLPDTLILPVPDDAELDDFEFLSSKPVEQGCCAYICEGSLCQPPMSDLDEYREHLLARAGHNDRRTDSPSPAS